MAEERSEAELWAQLGAATGGPRAELLLELADHKMEQADLAAAVSMLETAAAVSEEVGDDVLAGSAYQNLGRALFHDGEHEGSAAAYGKAADHFRNAGWDERLALCLWGQADALLHLGEWAKMLSVAENGLAIADADENTIGVANLSFQRARALYRLDRDEEALVESKRARDAFRKVGHSRGVAEVDEFSHRVCMYLGRLDEALELATNCYVLAGSTRTDQDEAMAQLRLAETHVAREEPADALPFAETARAWFKDHDDSIGVARSSQLRGRALGMLGRDAEALQSFVEARVMFDANGRDGDALESEALRAVHLHSLGRFAEAAAANSRLSLTYGSEEAWIPQSWAVARRIDNLVADGNWQDADLTAREWTGQPRAGDSELTAARVRIQALWAYALWKLGRKDEAFRIAEEAFTHISEDDVDVATATIFEVRGRYLLDQGAKGARRELSHAVALHLAVGSVEHARELSQVFLPELRRERRRKDPELPTSGAHGPTTDE